jgi:pimeloyl-ACP methyl ester carboxylesterase
MRTYWLSALAAVLAPCLVVAQPAPPEPLGIGLEGYPYPHPVRFLEFEVERQPVRMAYMDVAAAAAAPNPAPVVLLFHGKNMAGYYWRDTIKVLTDAGYRVVVPDQVGWGRSSKPDVRYTFDWLAANTAALLDHLKVPRVAAVVGHSTGGMLAVRFARTYGDRVGRLVLEGPVGMEDYRRLIPPPSDEALFRGELALTAEQVEKVFVGYFATDRPDLYRPLAEPAVRVLRSGEYPRWARASASAYQMIYQQPVRHEYDLLTMPTLIVVGDKDRTAPLKNLAKPEDREKLGRLPELAAEAVKVLPAGSRHLVIPACGHIPHLETPDVFHKAVLEFVGGR